MVEDSEGSTGYFSENHHTCSFLKVGTSGQAPYDLLVVVVGIRRYAVQDPFPSQQHPAGLIVRFYGASVEGLRQ